MRDHPQSPEWSSASASAKCQTTQVPAARGHQASEETFVQQCIGREKVWMGRGASSTAELEGGTGQWGSMPALHPTQPELALQPASLGGGQECTSPAQGPGLPDLTGPWLLRDLSRGSCHRETIRSCHLEIHFMTFPSALNSLTSALIAKCY